MLRLNLGQILVENPYYRRPSRVLLLGGCVQDEMFIRVLREVLSEQMDEIPEILGEGEAEGTTWAAAKGTAELAKRLPYDPCQISDIQK